MENLKNLIPRRAFYEEKDRLFTAAPTYWAESTSADERTVAGKFKRANREWSHFAASDWGPDLTVIPDTDWFSENVHSLGSDKIRL